MSRVHGGLQVRHVRPSEPGCFGHGRGDGLARDIPGEHY